ncbi:hypothetical protein NQ318_007804 [Aromia moschata]|uniref:Mos1 transposase HTH domain-containing protein n=1 Tax=Aromia moschata TaxID=1265417 RepID=A0AAV8Z2G3_9CUCU|nr:hypothetical protein NQ318_007804 [Aromia moschata]
MQRSLEQRMAIKFCVKLEKSDAETIPMLKKAFGVNCLSDRHIFRWHKAFAEGRENVNDENRAGRPSTSSSDDNVKGVRDLLNTDRRLSVRLIRLISETLDITKIIVHEIVSESLGMRKVCAKLLPKVLTDDQKARRVETCQELLDTCEDNPAFLDDVKTMLIGTTVTGKFYVEVLKRLKRRVKRVPDISKSWKLHHDNAPSHTCFLVADYLIKAGITVVSQPPYSPDKACTDALKAIPENDYRATFDAWKARWNRCVDAGGMYFESF